MRSVAEVCEKSKVEIRIHSAPSQSFCELDNDPWYEEDTVTLCG